MGDTGDWVQCVALEEERKLRGWIYFEDGNNRIVCISGKGRTKEESRAFGLGNVKDGAAII